MVEIQRQRIEQEMTKLLNDLDLHYLRKMQADMHRCAAVCCENKEASLEKVQKCVESCSVRINWAQSYVQTEMDHLQNKLQRCVMECNDDVKLKMGPNPSDSEVQKFTALFETCATKCVDTQVEYIPSLLNRMKANISKQQT
ncbi:protein FAM136A-like [Diorhabda carinulata]|uniref:protein FAM136A-like n=1 Tax=Diorhabda sublineata TaxID=1163346 RepID=UPI0024E08C68|nr:protein FAM136A-like [Diorhabda sublineata]XP_057656386.1 protein FAM136A-like [Diorhabda carinulata]